MLNPCKVETNNVYCPECEARIDANAVHCHECGALIKAAPQPQNSGVSKSTLTKILEIIVPFMTAVLLAAHFFIGYKWFLSFFVDKNPDNPLANEGVAMIMVLSILFHGVAVVFILILSGHGLMLGNKRFKWRILKIIIAKTFIAVSITLVYSGFILFFCYASYNPNVWFCIISAVFIALYIFFAILEARLAKKYKI